MSKWMFVGVPCLTCLSFLVAGARPGQLRDVTHVAADASFVPIVAESNGDGKAVLDEVRTKLRDARWLRVAIWQRLHDRDHPYESTAHLILGPDQCARMETTLQVGTSSCQQLLVCDGRALAEVERFAKEPEKISGCLLPGPEAVAVREQFLRKRGCTGPLPLLTEMSAMVRDWQMQRGAWRNHAVIRMQGTILPGQAGGQAHPPSSARSCRLTVDADTLLPLRLEWFKTDDPNRSPLLLEMEYRGLEINQPLSPEECARAFTYEPAEKTTKD